MRARSSEWILIGYFSYVALVASLFPLQSRTKWMALAVLALAATLLQMLALAESFGSKEIFSIARDWIALALTFIAYREMDFFSSLPRDFELELSWVEWDRLLLYRAGLQRAIEWMGVLLPGYLELCYLLVYAVGPASVAILYIERRRDLVDRLLLFYLLGTLLVYGMFPYFPSDPPRVLFGSDMPNVTTPLRQLNLWIVGGYGIHSSVFPSAHVSSAFSAAWALLWLLPGKRRYGWGMLVYAVSVAIATVYGRYHYAVDAAAGFGVSLVAATILLLVLRPRPLHPRGLP